MSEENKQPQEETPETQAAPAEEPVQDTETPAPEEAADKSEKKAKRKKEKYTFTAENALDLLLQETGRVFSQVLEDAGVYKNNPEGMENFLKFVDTVNQG